MTLFEDNLTRNVEEFDKPITSLNLRFDLFMVVVSWKFFNDSGQGVGTCRLCAGVILFKGVFSIYVYLLPPPFPVTSGDTLLADPFLEARRGTAICPGKMEE